MTLTAPRPPHSYFFHSNLGHLAVKRLLARLLWFMGAGTPIH